MVRVAEEDAGKRGFGVNSSYVIFPLIFLHSHTHEENEGKYHVIHSHTHEALE